MSFVKHWKRTKSERNARSQARLCSHSCVTPSVHPVNCPVLCYLLANVYASILVIFLVDFIAFQVIFSTKKEATQLELIKAPKSGFYSNLSSLLLIYPVGIIKLIHCLNDL